MTYAGWDLSYRTFQQSPYIAVGGETTIPNKGVPESVLFKDGELLIPELDYGVNYTEGTVTLATPAIAGEVYQLLNLSTFHIADTYTKTQIDNIALIVNFYTANTTTPINLIGNISTFIDIDCSGGSAFANLPTSPKKGVVFHFRDKASTISYTKKFTLKRTVEGSTIMGIAEDMDVTTPNCSFSATWNGSDWRIY